jgi:hypothetical protein
MHKYFDSCRTMDLYFILKTLQHTKPVPQSTLWIPQLFNHISLQSHSSSIASLLDHISLRPVPLYEDHTSQKSRSIALVASTRLRKPPSILVPQPHPQYRPWLPQQTSVFTRTTSTNFRTYHLHIIKRYVKLAKSVNQPSLPTTSSTKEKLTNICLLNRMWRWVSYVTSLSWVSSATL